VLRGLDALLRQCLVRPSEPEVRFRSRMSGKSAFPVAICSLLAGLAAVGAASAVRFQSVPTVAPSIRACVQQMGAASVQPTGVGDLGGVAHFAGVRQPFVWGWINVAGSARLQLYVVGGVYYLKSVPGMTATARHVLVKCLEPYAPTRSYYGHCSFTSHGDFCRP